MEERRTATLNNILETLGEIKQTANSNRLNVETLVNRVTVQNNRIGKIESCISFAKGIAFVLVIFMIPAFIRAFNVWLQWMLNK